MVDAPVSEEEEEKKIEPPNYTQIPNTVMDVWMERLKPATFKVLICLCRKTFGWHKTSDTISKNQIMKCTCLSKNTVQTAIEELEIVGLIKKYRNSSKSHGFEANTYAMSLQKPEDKIYTERGQNLGRARSKNDLGLGQNLTLQKKDLTKERILSNARPKKKEKKEKKPKKIDRSTFFECLKALTLPFHEKVNIMKCCPEEDRLNNAVAFATAKEFLPDNLAAVIISNYKNKRKPCKDKGNVVDKNKAFCEDFVPIMTQVLHDPTKSSLDPLKGVGGGYSLQAYLTAMKKFTFDACPKFFHYLVGGMEGGQFWEWDLIDFILRIKAYFTKLKLWNTDLEQIVNKHRV